MFSGAPVSRRRTFVTTSGTFGFFVGLDPLDRDAGLGDYIHLVVRCPENR